MSKVEEVFGISSKPVLSYVHREHVDGVFRDALNESDKHVVVYGSSKQGKTALRNRHLNEGEVAVVHCSPASSRTNIYQSILRQAGVKIEVSETKTSGLGGEVSGELVYKAQIPWVTSGEAKVGGKATAEKQTQLQAQYVGSDLSDAQAVYELLAQSGFRKHIVVENFHYLQEQVQKELAFDLKTFHELGLRFLILGVWREANYLAVYNGDIQDRVVEVPVEPWEANDLKRIIGEGERQLKIRIAEPVIELFCAKSFGNVGLFQEFLKTLCLQQAIKESQSQEVLLDSTEAAMQAVLTKVADQRGHLVKCLQTLAGRSRTDKHDPLVLPYYLVRVLLRIPVPELQAGVERNKLLEKLKEVHHDQERVRSTDFTNLLNRLPQYQKDISPPLVFYDSNQRRLKFVDTRQFLVLEHVPAAELEEEIPNPLEERDALGADEDLPHAGQ